MTRNYRTDENILPWHTQAVAGGESWFKRLWRWLFGPSRPRRGQIAAPPTLVAKVEKLGDRDREMIRVAEEAIRRGFPDQAIIAYQKAHALYHQKGAYLKCVAVLNHLVKLQPQSGRAYQDLAEGLVLLERQKEAHLAFQQAVYLYQAAGDQKSAEGLMKQLQKVRFPSAQIPSPPGGLQLNPSQAAEEPSSSPAALDSVPKLSPAPTRAPSEGGPLELDLDELSMLEGASEEVLAAQVDKDLSSVLSLPPEAIVKALSASYAAADSGERPLPEEPPLPQFEPLAMGVPKFETQPSENFDAQTIALDEDDEEWEAPTVGQDSTLAMPAVSADLAQKMNTEEIGAQTIAMSAVSAADLAQALPLPEDTGAQTIAMPAVGGFKNDDDLGQAETPLHLPSLAPLPTSISAETDEYEAFEDPSPSEAGAQTLYDPNFMAVHHSPQPKMNIPSSSTALDTPSAPTKPASRATSGRTRRRPSPSKPKV